MATKRTDDEEKREEARQKELADRAPTNTIDVKRDSDADAAKERAEELQEEIAEDPEDVGFIYVQSNLKPRADGGHPVALFETATAHPGGQAFVSGPLPAKVSPTAEVIAAIREERVVETTAAKAKSTIKKYHEERAEARKAAREALEA